MNQSRRYRVYRKDWEKLRDEKAVEREKRKLSSAAGVAGKSNSFVNSVSSGQEMVDVYLKPSGDESSEDEDGEEEKSPGDEEEGEKEADSFKNFLIRHKDESDKKAVKLQATGESSKET